MCRDSSVGIATYDGLEGLGIESRWRVRFSAPVQDGPLADLALCTLGTWSLTGVKRLGLGVDHPPSHLSPRLKKEYSYTSSPSIGLLGLLYGELYFKLFLLPLYATVYFTPSRITFKSFWLVALHSVVSYGYIIFDLRRFDLPFLFQDEN